MLEILARWQFFILPLRLSEATKLPASFGHLLCQFLPALTGYVGLGFRRFKTLAAA